MNLLEMMFYAEVESQQAKIKAAAAAIKKLPKDASTNDILTTLTENNISINDFSKKEFKKHLEEIS